MYRSPESLNWHYRSVTLNKTELFLNFLISERLIPDFSEILNHNINIRTSILKSEEI